MPGLFGVSPTAPTFPTVLLQNVGQSEEHRRAGRLAPGSVTYSARQPDATDPTPQGTNCQTAPRLPLNKPATITPLLRSSGDARYRPGEPLAVRVRNISRRGVGLAHDQRLERGFVLLDFKLENGEPLRFIADVLWCELQDSGGYFSGGKLLDVVSPSDAQAVRIP